MSTELPAHREVREPATEPAETSRPTALSPVVVDEAPMPRRVRRPRDLLRAVLVALVVVLVVLLGSIAVGTASGLEQDLIGAARGAPRLLLQIATFVASAGLLTLPFIAAIDLIVRRRSGLILDAIVAAAVCVMVTTSLTTWITTAEPARVLEALTKVLPDGTRSQSLNHVVAAVIAYLVVVQVMGRRRLRVATLVTVGAVLVSSTLSGRVTLLSVVVSILVGSTIGLATRYALGTVSSRPDGTDVASALRSGGLDIDTLTAVPEAPGDNRTYVATGPDAHRYDVTVLDRDQEGAGVVGLAWRQLRVIAPAARTRAVSVRATLEHDALASYAVAAAGVRTPRLALAAEISDDSAVLAFEHPRGRPFSELTEAEVSDKVLANVWGAHRRLLQAHVAHRGLTGDRILVHDDGTVELTDLRYVQVAATELHLRLDTTELLVTLALTIGSERAVRSGVEHLGADPVADALPLLQPVALTPSTRRAVRHARGLLHDIRDDVIAATPSPPTEPVQLQRVSIRTVISLVGLTIAAYFLLTQLGQVNLESIYASVNWSWATIALALSLTTYVGATLCLVGFVPEKVSLVRTFVAQVAASFVNLMAPSSLGGAALNARFLERSGIEPALAVATVGVSQVAAFAIHLLVLLVFGVLAGSAEHTDVTPSENVIIIVVIVLAAMTVFLLLPVGRRMLQQRIRPMVGRVVPRLIAVLQQPSKLATGLTGNLLLNLAYVFCLVASVQAFGGGASVVAIGVVYLAGSAVGSIVPTPGGIGAVEAAIAAGLTAAGVDAGVAVSAVLLFRIVTFWLPIAPGWLAFEWLRRRDLV